MANTGKRISWAFFRAQLQLPSFIRLGDIEGQSESQKLRIAGKKSKKVKTVTVKKGKKGKQERENAPTVI